MRAITEQITNGEESSEKCVDVVPYSSHTARWLLGYQMPFVSKMIINPQESKDVQFGTLTESDEETDSSPQTPASEPASGTNHTNFDVLLPKSRTSISNCILI